MLCLNGFIRSAHTLFRLSCEIRDPPHTHTLHPKHTLNLLIDHSLRVRHRFPDKILTCVECGQQDMMSLSVVLNINKHNWGQLHKPLRLVLQVRHPFLFFKIAL